MRDTVTAGTSPAARLPISGVRGSWRAFEVHSCLTSMLARKIWKRFWAEARELLGDS
jgi:hypothetical protein